MSRTQNSKSLKSRRRKSNTRNQRNSRNNVPAPRYNTRFANLFNEARWLVYLICGVVLAVMLFTWHATDNGFVSTTDNPETGNMLGVFGAYVSDILLYLLGLSAWWLVVLCFQRMFINYRKTVKRIEMEAYTQRLHWEQFVGFILTMIGSMGIEAARFQDWGAFVPDKAGGELGNQIHEHLQVWLGGPFSVFVLIICFLFGLSLFLGFSWLRLADNIGMFFSSIVGGIIGFLSARRDTRIGEAAKEEREEQLRGLKEKLPHHDKPTVKTDPDFKPIEVTPQRYDVETPARATKHAKPLTEEQKDAELGAVAKASDPVEPQVEAPAAPKPAQGRDGRAPTIFAPVAPDAAAKPADNDVPVFGAKPEPAQPASPEPATAQQPAAPQQNQTPPAAAPASTTTAASDTQTNNSNPGTVARPLDNLTRTGQVGVSTRVDYELPGLELLDPAPSHVESVPADVIEFNSRLIEKKLSDFNVSVRVDSAQAGPVITRYEIEPASGVKGSQIVNLSKDLARALSLVRLRIVETIPGKNLMGIELPNRRRQVVHLSEVIGSKEYVDSSSLLTMALGKDIAGKPVVANLAKMPHLLVAGTTGSGKSVGINAMIISMLYKADPSQVKMILIDPKMLEMSIYEGIPHLLAPVVTDMRHAANALNWCVAEMERRYRLLSKMGVRNLAGYNSKIRKAAENGETIPNPFSLTPDAPEPLTPMPFIVVIIDELADLMMVSGKKIEELIARLAQKARAAGIHLILATQRPSVDVITGLIKANIPTRIAFQVSSKVDSRTIMDQMGAESLLGQGDMLYMPPGSGYPQRVHGAFVSDDEVHNVVEFLKEQGEAEYVEGVLEGTVQGDGSDTGSNNGLADAEADPLYDQAVDIVIKSRKASISLVQRQLRIGYNRAARLLEQMEASGIVSPMQPNNSREVLVPADNASDD